MPTMEACYSIGVGNRFGALAEDLDDDPFERLKILEEAAKKKKVKQEQHTKEIKESKSVTKADKEKEKASKGVKGKPQKDVINTNTTPPSSQNKTVSKLNRSQIDTTEDVTSKKPQPRSDRPPRGSRGGGDTRTAESRNTNDIRNNESRENEARDTERPQMRRPHPPKDTERSETQDKHESNRTETGPVRSGFPSRNDEPRNQGGFGGPGRPNTRGRGMGRGSAPRGGKRNFDRHSGSDKTGVKSIEKREGGGARNWGNVKDDIDEHLNETDDAQNTSVNAEDVENHDPNQEAPPVVKEDTEVTAPVPEITVEEKQMTLDEWKAMQSKDVITPTYDIRKPDDDQWNKGYFALPKKTQQFADSDMDVEDHRNKHHKELFTDIKITFNEAPQRGGGGGRGNRRPGRGGPRGRGFGGRGRGDYGDRRNTRDREYAPRVDDERDFPQLGAA